MRVRWFVGVPWWIALWFWVIGFAVMFAAAVIVLALLLVLAVASGGSWVVGSAISKRWPSKGRALKDASRILWTTVDRFAGWADAVGIGRKPRA